MQNPAASPPREQGGRPLTDAERQKAYVAAVQRDLNRHLQLLGAPTRLAVDGLWGEATERAFRDVCRVLGLEPKREARTYRLIAGAAVEPTAAELAARKAEGAAYAAELRARYAHRQDGGKPRPAVAKAVVAGRSLPKDARERAYTAFVQRALNDHLLALGSPVLLAVDGRWGERTERAFRRVCRVVGVKPVRAMRTYRVLAGALAERAEDERPDADYARRLRAHFAAQRRKPPPPPVVPADEERIAAAIRRHGGRFEREIIAASRATRVPVALLCAIIETETGFQNVFGSDNVANPIKSRGRPYLKVTKARYMEYLRYRKQGLGQQGVGPMQLTTAAYQDRADRLGGCWKPGPNIMVGAQVLVEKTRAVGGRARDGVKAYNSWSPAGDAYAAKVMPRYRVWQQRLGAGPAPSGPRTLRLTSPPIRGPEVRRLQRALNKRLAALRVPKRLRVDGIYGSDTDRTARQVTRALGIPVRGGLTPAIQALIANPNRRTPAMKARAKARRDYRARLRKRYAAPPVQALLRGHRPPRSAYLLRAIERAHEHGLVVTSTAGGTHAKTSWHYQGLAVDFGIVPGSMSAQEKRRRLVRFQRELARDTPRLLELFGPDDKAVAKNGRPGVMSPALAAAHEDHVHLAAR